jgi:hypothetical protein
MPATSHCQWGGRTFGDLDERAASSGAATASINCGASVSEHTAFVASFVRVVSNISAFRLSRIILTNTRNPDTSQRR